jgi:Phasin protein
MALTYAAGAWQVCAPGRSNHPARPLICRFMLQCNVKVEARRGWTFPTSSMQGSEMAQVSNRNDAGKGGDNGKDQANKTKNLGVKVAEASARTGERAADAARDTAEQVQGASARVVHDATARLQRGLDAAQPAAREALKAETDLAGVWLSVAREQLQHNVETVRRLGTVRDLRDLAELQSEYARLSMARVVQAVFRQFDLAGHVFAVGAKAAKRGG